MALVIAYPVLVYFRSKHANQSWLAALTAILDVCALVIAGIANQFWEERGRPLGSSEEDWFRAERELRHHFGPSFPLDSPMALPLSSFMVGPMTQ